MMLVTFSAYRLQPCAAEAWLHKKRDLVAHERDLDHHRRHFLLPEGLQEVTACVVLILTELA